MTSRTKLKRKQVDDVLGGDEQWKHADSTNGKIHEIPLNDTSLSNHHNSDMPEVR